MGHNDFRTDKETAAIEAARTYRPELEKLRGEIEGRDRIIKEKDKQIAVLKEEVIRLRLRLDDALDAAGFTAGSNKERSGGENGCAT
jgi:hypothetical protein